ncbi:FKBP-type peptidyl-prolyl cis-trans isomerase [Caulobacter sp. 17J80-11]|uniref:FKBP-type peptidyl-prolyl cis-trans isomerase n=1 Tax=Caulobacter sp. 17J80-11 TaxID=2763502 RepID=UPI001653D7C0|nr:FKBP-type peptidyl-prolyl cis-trans isomerase [Caulobacter sp. 17J80-11]MBC6983611.1 FKBP-type peptidyl-prolyl cis-trans isomerase [Caulobacter sp. 17J80-11]
MSSPMRKALAVFALAAALSACGPKVDPAAAAAGLAEAKAFFAKNAKAEGVRTLPDGLQYKVVRSGAPDAPKPDVNDEVKVHYEGALLNGEVFDSSFERGSPETFELAGLVKAWQEAIPMMRVGDEWILYVPPELGYGEEGSPPTIPPNATLVFRIELLGVLPHAGGESGNV